MFQADLSIVVPEGRAFAATLNGGYKQDLRRRLSVSQRNIHDRMQIDLSQSCLLI